MELGFMIGTALLVAALAYWLHSKPKAAAAPAAAAQAAKVLVPRQKVDPDYPLQRRGQDNAGGES